MAAFMHAAANLSQLKWTAFSLRFHLLEELATGRYGTLFLARDAQTDEKVAVKCIDKTDTCQSNFIRELQYSLAFSVHPNIIKTCNQSFDVVDSYILIQEYADGGTLLHHAKHGECRLEESKIVRYLKHICLALHYLHSHGFVHRDIKPDNVVLCRSSPEAAPGSVAFQCVFTAKLIDFGLTRVVGHACWSIEHDDETKNASLPSTRDV